MDKYNYAKRIWGQFPNGSHPREFPLGVQKLGDIRDAMKTRAFLIKC
jgi:hypothetical protein